MSSMSSMCYYIRVFNFLADIGFGLTYAESELKTDEHSVAYDMTLFARSFGFGFRRTQFYINLVSFCCFYPKLNSLAKVCVTFGAES